MADQEKEVRELCWLRPHLSLIFDRNGVWEGDELDLYYPIFMTVKFLFFFGWLRVAETLYNPFGEDDDDFELNELIQRHFRVSLNIVDDGDDPPALQRDIFWDQTQIYNPVQDKTYFS